MLDVAVVGGGAAGFFAAINIRKKHPRLSVRIFEKSKTVLGKVSISGGGRCNVTHSCFDNRQLITYYPRGGRELLSVFERFAPADTIAWFAGEGVTLKTEPDGRMFPTSDDSQTIVDCFINLCRKLQVAISTNSPVNGIKKKDEAFELEVEGKIVKARHVIIAAGSSQYLWDLLQGMGHHIVNPVPSLFTFNTKNAVLKDLMGVSVKHASVRLMVDREDLKAFRLKSRDIVQQGPLLVTHWGLSGPAVLKLSSLAALLLHKMNYKFRVEINLCPFSAAEVLGQLFKQRKEAPRKQLSNTPLFDITSRMWHNICEHAIGVVEVNWADLSNQQLQQLTESITRLELDINGKSTFKEEFVTAGGVDLKEVDFRTMQSKVVPGMFLAGEVLNIDALTGGFNFQAAWSEAWVISESLLPQG